MSIIEDILKLENECFDRPWQLETLSLEINSPLCSLTCEERDGKIAAYALGRVVVDEGELLRLGTSPQHRRQGLADNALSALLDKMRRQGAIRCFLEVRSRNAPAISLYEKHGFKRVGLRKKYYGDDDAVVMSAEL